MPRAAGAVGAGTNDHVLNRGNGRKQLFHKPGDYQAFIKVLSREFTLGNPGRPTEKSGSSEPLFNLECYINRELLYNLGWDVTNMNTNTIWRSARENLGTASLALAVFEWPWISIVSSISYIFIFGDIDAKGTARVLLYLCFAAPSTLAVILGVTALAQSTPRADKILGIIGLVANIIWTGYLALLYTG